MSGIFISGSSSGLGPVAAELLAGQVHKVVFHCLALATAITMAALSPAAGQDTGAATAGEAATETRPGRKITRFVPIPKTISAEAQAVLAGPPSPYADVVPATPEAWKTLIAEINAGTWTNLIQPALAAYPVIVERREIAGVPVAVVTPKGRTPPANNRRTILNIHGGAFIVNGGRQAILEAIPIASLLRMPVIAVDYRMPPDHPFPAGLQDSLAVYQALIRSQDRRRVAVYGTSAGGNLAVAMLLRARAQGLPMPGAVALVSPWSDIGPVGDSLGTNAVIDPTLVHYNGLLRAAAELYAGGIRLDDPRVSPVYGHFGRWFPPTLLLSGSRDLLLSGTTRLQQRLVEAGVVTEMQLFEALWHDFPVSYGVPEAATGWQQVAQFLDRRLAR